MRATEAMRPRKAKRRTPDLENQPSESISKLTSKTNHGPQMRKNVGNWTFSWKTKWDHDWSGDQKTWFAAAQREAEGAMKKADPKKWKKMKRKRLQQQMDAIDN